MSDEDATFEPPRAAIPSRAAGATVPPPNQLPPVQEAPAPIRKKIAPTRTTRLPSREIKRINTNRKRNIRAMSERSKKTAKRAASKAPKNPNRPLELKNQMAMILATATKLTREELGGFMVAIETVGKLSRRGRANVITALANTYGIKL